ncbi:MAG: PAS domain S-box protein, partial [archaeon]|nr:PAS domain S-box protein [archaeon]
LENIHPEDRGKIIDFVKTLQKVKTDYLENKIIRLLKNNLIIYCDIYFKKILYEGKNAILVAAIDITKRIHAEKEKISSETKYRNLFNNLVNGFALFRIIKNEEGKTIDYEFIEVNPAFSQITGIPREKTIGQIFTQILPNIEEKTRDWINQKQRSQKKDDILTFEEYFPPLKKWLHINAYSPENEFFIIIFSDITKKMQAERDLKKKTEEQKILLDTIDTQIWFLKDKYTYGVVNQAVADFNGISKQDIEGKKIDDIFPQERSDLCILGNHEVYVTKETFHSDEWVRNGTGENRRLSITKTPKLNEKGEIEYVVCSATDITENKKAEEKLKKSEKMLKQTQKIAKIGSFEWDLSTNIMNRSDEIFQIYQIDKEKNLDFDIEKMLQKTIHPDDREKMRMMTNKVLKEHVPISFKYRLIRPDGEERIIFSENEIYKDNKEKTTKLVGYIQDITERVKTEERLRQEERKFHTIADYTVTWEYWRQPEEGFLYVSPSCMNITGYSADEFYSNPELYYSIIHPDDNKIIEEHTKRRINNEQPESIEFRIIKKSGEIRWIDHICQEIITDTGKNLGIRGSNRDITERKKAVEKLLFIQKAVENTSDAIGMSDPDGHHFYQNKAFSDLFEYDTAEELESVGGGPAIIYDKLIAEELFENIMNGKSWKGELEMITKSGKIIPVFQSADCIKDDKDNIIGLIGIIKDNTESKETQDKLEKSEEKFSKAFKSSPTLFGISRLIDGKFFEVNDAFCKILKISREEVIGKTSVDLNLLKPEDRKIMKEKMNEEGKLENFEMNLYDKEGGELIGLFSAEIIEIEEEKCLVMSVVDITKRTKAENALRESEEKFRLVSDQNLMGIHIISDGLVKYINKASADILGYEIDEILKWGPNEFAKVIHPDDLPFIMEQARKKQSGSEDIIINYTWRCVSKSGKIKWVETYSKPIPFGEKFADLVTMIDISERFKTENALKQSEENYRTLVETSTDIIAKTSIDGNFIYINKAMIDILGFSQEELFSMRSFDKIHPDDIPTVIGSKDYILSGKEIKNLTYRVLTKKGKYVYISNSLAPIFNSDGEVIEILHIARNITDQKKTENALRISEEKYKMLVEHMNEGLLLANNEHKIVYINSRLCEITGYTPDELIGKRALSFVKEEEIPATINQEKNREQGLYEPYEFNWVGKSGSIIPTLLSPQALFDSKNNFSGTLVVVTDLTKMKKLEDEKMKLQQESLKAQKIESIGVLAGGIAHDFNNLLTAIMGNISIAKLEVDNKNFEELIAILEEAESASFKAKALTKQLLTFSKGGAPIKSAANIEKIITDSANFVLRGSNVKC